MNNFYRLGKHQLFIKQKLGSKLDKPTFLVMHGGSGSTAAEIQCAVKNGVIKMNIDTDTQWAYWAGIKKLLFLARDESLFLAYY